jgi:Glutamine synthetase
MFTTVRKAAFSALPALLMSGCIPFVVGSTARPVAPGESMRSMSFYSVPNSFDGLDSSRSYPRAGVDTELRYGLDDRSDLGLRIPSYSGAIINYKRRLNGATANPGVAVAVLTGAGLVNWGDHAHFELSLLASGEENQFTPYGGLRAMQVVPISQGAVKDSPTFGGFFGVRIGAHDFALSEIGVFHDHSALGIRKGNIIVVPSITMSRIRHQ